MVPKLHKKGSSFRGIGMYVLHDKDHADTSERVEWTQTRNLASDDPDLAWRLMAATAMDATRLKANAGVKNTGRKSKNTVLHLTLSWHPEEGEELCQGEMMRAANGALKALGAQDHQVLVVCHRDEEQPHIHLVINRVSPEDGRLLPSSKDRLNLSKWAQAYENERGRVYCEDRVLNNAARDRGEFVRGEKDVPRHIYEQQAINDNKQVRHQQRVKDRAVGKQQRATKNRQAKDWALLQSEHKEQRAAIHQWCTSEIVSAKQRVRDQYKDSWRELFHEQQADMLAFERDESSFLGRMKNRVKGIDFKAMIGGDQKKQAIGDAFDAFASSGARLEQIKKLHARQDAKLRAEQRSKEVLAAKDVRINAKTKLTDLRVKYQNKRASLVLTQSMEQAKMRAQWKTRKHQRNEAMKPARHEHSSKDRSNATPRSIEEAKRAVEEFKKNAKNTRKPRDQDQDRGRD